MTIQKAYALLRKMPGYFKAEYHRSRMIRGWGSWTSGYRCKKYGDEVLIEFMDNQTTAAIKLEQAKEFLEGKGVPVRWLGSNLKLIASEAA